MDSFAPEVTVESLYLKCKPVIWPSNQSQELKQGLYKNELLDMTLRDWSLITGRGGLQNGKIAGPKLFVPPPQDRVKLFAPPPFKEWKLFVPPLQYG